MSAARTGTGSHAAAVRSHQRGPSRPLHAPHPAGHALRGPASRSPASPHPGDEPYFGTPRPETAAKEMTARD